MEAKKCRRRFLRDCAKMGRSCDAYLVCRGLRPAEGLPQAAKPIDHQKAGTGPSRAR